jgi:probable rRNA maturation factor
MKATGAALGAATGKMILLDPDLDPDPPPRKNAVPPLGVRKRAKVAWAERIPTKQTLSRFLKEAQAAVRLRGEVTVLLTTDAAIRKLNKQFRGKNKATDVLSFPAEGPMPGTAPEEMAGDLAIGVETARRQAAEQGHALTCELKVLVLHGLLHLAGYDHEADAGKMAKRERLLRGRLRLPLGLIERAGTASPVAKKSSSGAKAPLPSVIALRGLKPPPPSGSVLRAPTARLKPRPFKTASKRKKIGPTAGGR